jgi:hypothetical protein
MSKMVILFQSEFCLQEEGLRFRLISWESQRRVRAPMSYGSFYPTFGLAGQARNRLGRRVRRHSAAAMSRLYARFKCWPWASPQAGARSTSQLGWHTARPLPQLPEDVHVPPAAFSPLQTLQPLGSGSGLAAARPPWPGYIWLGTGSGFCFRGSNTSPKPAPPAYRFRPGERHSTPKAGA